MEADREARRAERTATCGRASGPPTRRAIRLAALLSALLPIATLHPAEAAANPHPTTRFVVSDPQLPTARLALRQPVDATLRGPEVRRYGVAMQLGQFAAVRIRQLEGNVVAVVFDPDGRLVAIVDENGAGQAEVATFVATRSGEYAIQVAVFEWDAPPVRYQVELQKREPARTDAAGRAGQLFDSWYEADEPGAVVLVLQHGRPVFGRAIGRADVARGTPLTQETPIDLASVSKQFTGYAIAMLAERGALRLDDDIRRYLPELPDYGTPITLRNLLEHTSGVRDWDGLFGLVGRRIEDGITTDEALAMLARQRALVFAPGSRQQYSNSGYVLLALVVERVTGQPFDAWMTRNVLAPLDLRQCRLARGRVPVADPSANSYRATYPSPLPVSTPPMVVLGSSSLECSAHDLALWLANYSTGRLGGPPVRELVTGAGLPPTGDTPTYVFGNWHSVRDGVRVVGHQGLAAGFRTSTHTFPERGLSVIYLANDGNDATYPRIRAVEDLFLGIEPPPVVAPDVNYEPTSRETLPASKFAAYTGRYASPDLQATYSVEASGAGVALRGPGLGLVELTWQGDDTFASGNEFLPQLVFGRDARGNVSGFEIQSEDVGSLQFERTGP